MNTAARLGTPSLCWLLAGLLVALPACQGPARDHPEAVARLLVDAKAPQHYEEQFKPIPPEDLARFELPAPKAYLLGRGDVVRVSVLNTEQVPGWGGALDVRVKDDGGIYLPAVGRVEALDHPILDLEGAIAERIKSEGYLQAPVVSANVVEYAARKFYVMGQVSKPSALPVNGRTTLLEALIEVGGTGLESADLEEAYVVRNLQPYPFSIRDIATRGHPGGRLVMEENDIVYIPHVKDRQDFVYLMGSVTSPGRIEMQHTGPRGTRGDLTLAAALAQVGGLKPGEADTNCISVFRGGWQNPKVFTIAQHELLRYGEDIHLLPGDRVYVAPNGWSKFNATLGPSLTIISAVSSLLSLSISALALAQD